MYLLQESFWPALSFGFPNKILQKVCIKHMEEQIGDPAENPGLKETLIPSYEVGCKRILVTNKWIPAMKRKNVHLVTD